MASIVMLTNPQTGLIKKGFFGFSWTTFFFGGFPALFRGDLITGAIVIALNIITVGVAGLIWAFIYNKQYTTKLIEQGYVMMDSADTMARAQATLCIAPQRVN